MRPLAYQPPPREPMPRTTITVRFTGGLIEAAARLADAAALDFARSGTAQYPAASVARRLRALAGAIRTLDVSAPSGPSGSSGDSGSGRVEPGAGIDEWQHTFDCDAMQGPGLDGTHPPCSCGAPEGRSDR